MFYLGFFNPFRLNTRRLLYLKSAKSIVTENNQCNCFLKVKLLTFVNIIIEISV